MKKFFLFAIAVLSFWLFMCTSVMADIININGINYIDIGLFYGNSAKESVTISSSYGSGTVYAVDVTSDLQYNSDGIITVDGKQYRGSIILKKDANNLLTVINRVNLESYVASVIAVEMSPSFNIEALKAQAVCARTYALKNINKHSSRGFSLCAGVDCQAYNGVSSESERTNRAAKETAGIVIKYNGNIIDAVYSATSGGWTEDVKHVWGSDIPYLKAVEDSYESKNVFGSTWNREITLEKANEIMDNKGYGLGTVTNIEVLESTEHGVVTKLKVSGTEGEKIFTNEGCRLAFGTVTLSQAFAVYPKSDKMQYDTVYTYGNKSISGNVTVLSADGKTEMELDNVTLLGNTKRDYSGKVLGDIKSFVFKGRGYGHLVGLSQNGANGMAGAGYNFEQILKHYYKGIELGWI